MLVLNEIIIMNDLVWIQDWFSKQCDGYWEHDHGITIETLDNPGWYLTVELEETDLQDLNFEIIKIDRSDNDWIRCSIENNVFKGFAGPYNLPEILQIFRNWAEKSASQKQG
jgi:hypothetical protein